MLVCQQCKRIYSDQAGSCHVDRCLLTQGDDPLVGNQVDRYQIIEQIGHGAFGVVYRASHTILDRQYALKVLYSDIAEDPTFAERFRREARSASMLHHRNVVSVTDYSTDERGLPYLVMELVEGKTLEQELREAQNLDRLRTIGLGIQIAAGLEEIHRLGFIHRDLKPANIMLTTLDNMEMAKILDLGMVKICTQPANDEQLTLVGHVVGTPRYMAPEQCQEIDVTPAADLYALGVLMYEMLTGDPPFVGLPAQVIMQHVSATPKSLPDLRGLDTVVAKLLSKSPSDRQASASDVIVALQAISDDFGPTAPISFGNASTELNEIADPRTGSTYPTGPISSPAMILDEAATIPGRTPTELEDLQSYTDVFREKTERVDGLSEVSSDIFDEATETELDSNSRVSFILVVDESKTLRAFIGGVLEQHVMLEASTIAEADEALGQRPLPRAVICQRFLADGSGLNLCRRMCEDVQYSGIPFVLMVDEIDVEASETAKSAGARALMTRTVTPARLRTTLDHVLNR